jgi:3-phosphoshikimate 1-carboxyvinyltransferase
MTLSMMRHFGITIEPKTFDANNGITITPQAYNTDAAFLVEGDWSSASYWYAFAACANEVDLTIHGLRKDSLQGDSALASFFKELGIETTFKGLSITLSKTNSVTTNFNYDFSDCPDLAQTVATTVSPLNIPSTFEGLHTLRIKETDRTAALKAELAKLGTAVELINNGDSIKITPDEINKTPKAIATYEDHRMAMAFAVYAMANDYIDIEEPEVVKKSYPDFWKDLKKMGFQIEEI